MTPDRRNWSVLIPVEHQPGRFRTVSTSSMPTPDSACSLASQYPDSVVLRDGFAARAFRLLTSWLPALPDAEAAEVRDLFADHDPAVFEPRRQIKSTVLDRQAKPLIDFAVYQQEVMAADHQMPVSAQWLANQLVEPNVPPQVIQLVAHSLYAIRASGIATWPVDQPLEPWLISWFGTIDRVRTAAMVEGSLDIVALMAVASQVSSDVDTALAAIRALLESK